MTIGETQPLEAGATIPEVGNSPEIADDIFRLRPGDDSPPIQTDKGYVVLTLKDVQAAHPGTLAEVHDKVLADYRRDKSVELAKSRADGSCAGAPRAVRTWTRRPSRWAWTPRPAIFSRASPACRTSVQ